MQNFYLEFWYYLKSNFKKINVPKSQIYYVNCYLTNKPLDLLGTFLKDSFFYFDAMSLFYSFQNWNYFFLGPFKLNQEMSL